MNIFDIFKFLLNVYYLYLFVLVDLNVNLIVINGSVLYFDNDCYYFNWFINYDINKIILLFVFWVWRWDDIFDMDNYLREFILDMVFVLDVGSGFNKNYIVKSFCMNFWYNFWLFDK